MRISTPSTVALMLASVAMPALAVAQPTSVVASPHNLSAGGPGAIKASFENEVCIFCHAPHNSAAIRPLWNRATPTDAYSIYASRSLSAKPGQPTGVSKMCLSCHDGTIALGSVISRDTPISMQGGVTTMPQGPSRLGTDLRDDHPISFTFDQSLAGKNPKLKSPSSLPPEVHLDANRELQCTSCHDAHNNQLGKFLVMHNENSQLCNSCHQMGQTTVNGHSSCSSCHQPHSAPSGPYLLRKNTITETCNTCHNGTVALAPNISSEISKLSHHDTHPPVDPTTEPSASATCTDCHEPHTMMKGLSTPPAVPSNFGRINGVSASGSALAVATSEFEVCFKCHADTSTRSPWISRQITQANTRLEFGSSAISFHPVETTGRNMSVPSLKPGWTTSSRMSCSSCHGSDAAPPQGSGPKGVHGSMTAPVLVARYDTQDYTTESAAVYALCYSCHDRASILGDKSFKLHKEHIVEKRTPCSVCHDSHGIAGSQGTLTGNSNLINFQSGIVTADRITGRLEFRDTGDRTGECYLSCHNVNHSPKKYKP